MRITHALLAVCAALAPLARGAAGENPRKIAPPTLFDLARRADVVVVGRVKDVRIAKKCMLPAMMRALIRSPFAVVGMPIPVDGGVSKVLVAGKVYHFLQARVEVTEVLKGEVRPGEVLEVVLQVSRGPVWRDASGKIKHSFSKKFMAGEQADLVALLKPESGRDYLLVPPVPVGEISAAAVSRKVETFRRALKEKDPGRRPRAGPPAAAKGRSLPDYLWPDVIPAPWAPWVRLLAAAIAVVLAGIKLSRYGDLLSERLKLGQAVVGMIFVAFATSLPEIVTCVGAVAVQEKPGLAVGNGFGSIAFNLAIIFVVDVMAGKLSLFHYVSKGAARPGWLSLIIIAVFGGALALERFAPQVPVIPGLRVGAGSLLVLAAYVAGVWWLSRRARGEKAAAGPEGKKKNGKGAAISTAGIFVRYGIVALVILWAGLNLSAAGDRIAEQHGLGTTFVGVIFLAVATSLPELTVAVTAARAGLHEMILGNIFGANMFNVVVIAVSDFFYRGGTLAGATVNGEEALPGVISVAFAAAITCVAVFGVRARVKARVWRATLPSIAILLLYLGMTYWLYALK